jgi:tetratricopeptide (TPR) repeat protein
MIVALKGHLFLLMTMILAAGAGRQDSVDPALRAAVDRYFATQQTEDVDGYMSLWAATAQRPRLDQLKFVFASGDDTFSDVVILKTMVTGELTRVRVSAVRQRTAQHPIAGRPPITRESKMLISLTYVQEGGEWKLFREAPASDDLAAAVIEAQSVDDRRRLLDADAELLDERLLQAIGRRAGGLAQEGRHADAQSVYSRMLEVARYMKDRKYEGEALQNIGNSFYFLRQYPAALEAYRQRLEIERERGSDEGIAAALGGMATIRYSLAEYGPALTGYRETLAIQERLGDEPGLAMTLISIGNVLYLQGDYDDATAHYRRSHELNRKLANTHGEASALEGLGRIFLARGDYAGALEAFEGVLAEGAARNDRVAQGSATLNIGEVHFRLGNLETARKTFEDSRSHFEAQKDAANVGRVWQAIALTDLVAGRYTVAESEYRKSIDSCVTVSDQECVAAGNVGVGFAQTSQEKFVEAIASYKRAIGVFVNLRRPEQAARAEIGLAQALAGNLDYKSAIEAGASARQRAMALGNDDVLWRALICEARALRKLNDAPAAMTAAAGAKSALDRLVAAAIARPAAPVARDSSTIFALLAILHAESGDPAAAFEAVELMRAHTLRVLLGPAEREISRGMTDAEKEEERALSVELVSLHAQLTRERGLPKPDTARIAKLDEAIKKVEEQRAAQQGRLFGRLPDLRIWRGLMEPAVRSDVHAVLETRDDALVEFVVDEEDVLVVSARLGETGPEFGASVHAIKRHALADAIAKLMTIENLRAADGWRKLSNTTLRPIVTAMATVAQDARRLLVIPHEVLWRVPFEALPAGPGFVGSGRRVSYAPSVTALLRAPVPAAMELVQESQADATGVLLAGAPDLAPAMRDRVARVAPSWVIRPVESADQEMKTIVEALTRTNVTGVRGPEASESALREFLPQAQTIHVAAPFRISGASPLFSPILLSEDKPPAPAGGAPDPQNDGSLEAREIMNLSLRARVAVLSDGSAMSMRDAADDTVLIYWAWRAAGVPYLVISRWPADASVSDRFLAEFHRALNAGDPPASAFRGAQDLLRRSDSTLAPHHWAGWVLIGR